MRKLFNLKEWLTLADTASHLSIVLGEQVTEADILRLGLDGHLRLSVHFVNYAHARCGNVVGPEELVFEELPAELVAAIPNLPPDASGMPIYRTMSLEIDEARYINLGDKITTIQGVWDLPMFGCERLEIENAYQRLTGGPLVTLYNMEVVFVQASDGQVCQLQQRFNDDDFSCISNDLLARLEKHIVEKQVSEEDAVLFRTRLKERNEKALKKRRERSEHENYFPTINFPHGSVIVVRTQALRDFEQSLNEVPVEQEKPLTATERNSMLIVIAALCEYSAIDFKARGAASQIAKFTEEIGAAVSDDTVRRLLNKVPDALESRMK